MKVEWQPIETAPRDGTPFFASGWDCGKVGGTRHYAIAKFLHIPDLDVEEFVEDDERETPLEYLTHWAPLLDFPK